MQTQNEDRRAPRVRRIELATLVEICGKEPDVPAFEARTIEISGRGMQVETRFLPELGTPLVMRFERDGHEVLVEGEVAWRKAAKSGGQFGVKFTALDSKSVSALKALCAAPQASKPQAPPPSEEELEHADAVDEPHLSEPGAAVKLHIQGLGAPMKARVRKGTPRKVQVGSQLEFLKVGRSLELEDVTAGERRSVHIDAVTVAIEPETQIPQLVVSLRYEGAGDDTPEPTVVSRADADEDGYEEDDFDGEYDEEVTEDLFKGKVGALAANAGRAMRDTSVNVARWSSQAMRGFGGLLQRGASKASESVAKSRTPRRTSQVPKTTAPLRRGQRGERASELRGQRNNHPAHSHKRRPGNELPQRRPKLWMYAGALVLGASGVYALTHSSESDATAASASASADPRLQAPAGSAAGHAPVGAATAASLPGAQPPLPTAVAPEHGGPFPPRAELSIAEQQQADTGGIVAQVPLFGAKAMATMEEAPPNPMPVARVDEYSLAKDQSFDDRVVAAPRAENNSEEAEAAPSPEGATEFQVGRMHLPVIHRLRLDAAGATLQGNKTDTGFSVLIPGRKVMENGASISGRDDRIVDVRVNNTPAGGKVTFRFRGEAPGYKARLRKDYVEFFVNSPAKKK